jgi:glucuronokinase
MSRAEPAFGRASARAALAGNPSDGYGGAVLAVTIDARQASAEARTADPADVEPTSPLVVAARERFARLHCPSARRTAIRWSTAIPRSVGLAGSSAIAIATLRALCELHEVRLTPLALAELALAVEVEDLGIAAGPQDRVVQAYGGLTFMDFGCARYERMEANALPPLLVAWRADAPTESGQVHAPLRKRFAGGEPAVLDGLRALARLAREAREALSGGDIAHFSRCVDGSFDVRRGLIALEPSHVAMVEGARAHGAAANYAGSGGAIVAVCPDGERQRDAVATALGAAGCHVERLS